MEHEAPENAALREWLWNFMVEHFGEERWFFILLDRGLDWVFEQPLTEEEADRAELFKEMIAGLTELLGSEAAAADWLLHNPEFKLTPDGDDPVLYLERGGYWSLALLNNLVNVALAKHRAPQRGGRGNGPARPPQQESPSAAHRRPTSTNSQFSMAEIFGMRRDEGQPLSMEDRDAAISKETWQRRESASLSMYELDLLTGTWGWSQDEIAKALGTDPEQLRAWRNHEGEVSEEVAARYAKLRAVQYELWAVLSPGEYSRWWRAPNDAFEGRAAIEVALNDEDGFDRVVGACRSASW